jgi:hypothetical protein
MLAHTFLASLHYHSYDDIQSDILKIVISITGRIIQISRIICQSSQICFEEDFDGDTLGFPLDPDGSTDERIEGFMDLLIIGLQQTLLSKDIISSFAEVDCCILEDVNLVKPLLQRLELLSGIYQMWKVLLQKEYSQAVDWIAKLKVLLNAVIETKDLGSNMESQFDKLHLIKSFPQAPAIRKSLSLDEGFQKLSNLFGQLDTILTLRMDLDCSNFIFLINSFSYYNPDAVCFARGISMFVFQSRLQQLGESGIIKTVKEFAGISQDCYLDLKDGIDSDSKKSIESIFLSIESLLQATVKTYSVSRSRQRRHLFHLILSWEELEQSLMDCEKRLEDMMDIKVFVKSYI